MLANPPPLKKFEEYTHDELYALVMEEMPILRQLAIKMAEVISRRNTPYAQDQTLMKKLQNSSILWREIETILQRWQDCLGSQADAKNG